METTACSDGRLGNFPDVFVEGWMEDAGSQTDVFPVFTPQNGLTPLHVAAHYDNQPVALLLLDKGASPHATAKVGPPHTHSTCWWKGLHLPREIFLKNHIARYDYIDR